MAQPRPNNTCFSLSGSSYCNDFRNVFIQPLISSNNTLLYNDTRTFDAWIGSRLADSNFISQFYSDFQCNPNQSNFNATGVQYFVSFTCASVAANSNCTQNFENGRLKGPGLCQSSCNDYLTSLDAVSKVEKNCNGGPAEAKQRKLDSVKQLCDRNIFFNSTSNCVNAASNEQTICGKSSTTDMCTNCPSYREYYKSFCEKYPLEGITNTVASPVPPSNNGSQPAASTDNTPPNPLIVGSILGGIFLLVIGLSLVAFIRKKRNIKKDEKPDGPMEGPLARKYSLGALTVPPPLEVEESGSFDARPHSIMSMNNINSTRVAPMLNLGTAERQSVNSARSSMQPPPSPRKDSLPSLSSTPNRLSTLASNTFTVTHIYRRALDDELDLDIGDMVLIVDVYDDGWAYGQNMTKSSKAGVFPLACVNTLESMPEDSQYLSLARSATSDVTLYNETSSEE